MGWRFGEARIGMKQTGNVITLVATILLAGWLGVLPVSGQEGDKEKGDKRSPKEERGRPPGEPPRGGDWGPGDNLTPEERARIRATLSEVWNDEAVVLARQEVKTATDQFRKTIEDAVLRIDPEVAELMKKMHEGSQSHELEHRGRGGGPFGGPGGREEGPPRGGPFDGKGGPDGGRTQRSGGRDWLPYDLSVVLARPPFWNGLSDEQKQSYDQARKDALESEPVKAVRERIGESYKQYQNVRRRQIESLKELRRTVMAEIAKSQPELADKMKAWEEEEARREADSRGGPPRGPMPPPDGGPGFGPGGPGAPGGPGGPGGPRGEKPEKVEKPDEPRVEAPLQ